MFWRSLKQDNAIKVGDNFELFPQKIVQLEILYLVRVIQPNTVEAQKKGYYYIAIFQPELANFKNIFFNAVNS